MHPVFCNSRSPPRRRIFSANSYQSRTNDYQQSFRLFSPPKHNHPQPPPHPMAMRLVQFISPPVSFRPNSPHTQHKTHWGPRPMSPRWNTCGDDSAGFARRQDQQHHWAPPPHARMGYNQPGRHRSWRAQQNGAKYEGMKVTALEESVPPKKQRKQDGKEEQFRIDIPTSKSILQQE